MSDTTTTLSATRSADDQAGTGSAERLRRLSEWVDATGAIGKDGVWYGELQAIVAGKGRHE